MKYQFKVSTSNPNNGNIVEFDPEAGHNHDGLTLPMTKVRGFSIQGLSKWKQQPLEL